MQIRAEPENRLCPFVYSQILYQFLAFTQNLKRSRLIGKKSFPLFWLKFFGSIGSILYFWVLNFFIQLLFPISLIFFLFSYFFTFSQILFSLFLQLFFDLIFSVFGLFFRSYFNRFFGSFLDPIFTVFLALSLILSSLFPWLYFLLFRLPSLYLQVIL